MTKPHQSELNALSDYRLLYLLISDESNGSSYRRQILTRMSKSTNGSIFAKIDAEKNQQKPRRRPTRPIADDGTRWRTDRELAEETEFLMALETLRRTVYDYWPDDQQKDAEEIEVFLESLIDADKEYEDLTEPQKRLLGMARRYHSEWVRKNDK